MILLITVLCAAVMKAVTDLVAGYATQAGEVHRLTSPSL